MYNFLFSIHPFLIWQFPSLKKFEFLTVGLWNANKLRNKANEFKDFVYAYNFVINLVSETHFPSCFFVKVLIYDFPCLQTSKWWQTSCGGTVVFVKYDLNAFLNKVPKFHCIEAIHRVLDLPSPRATCDRSHLFNTW